MPISVVSYLVPRSGGTYFLIDDRYVRGGLQVVASATERDSIDASNVKAGMLVFTRDTSKMWQLGADLTTWSEFTAVPKAHTHTPSEVGVSASSLISEAERTAWNGKQDALGFTPYNATNPNGFTSNVGTVTSVSGTGAISVANGTSTPSISIAAATASVPGTMSASDKSKLDGIAAGANAYVHPTGDGNLHVPATGTTNNGKVLTAGSTAGSLSWSSAGTVTSVSGSGAISVATGSTTPVVSIAAATTSVPGTMSATDKSKLDGIAANANNYTHPTGDGNLHVPATGTTNSGKVLTAGATAGSLSWAAPVATSANLQVSSLGVGTAAAGTAGDIRATGDVTAFYSDARLKTVLGPIPDALRKVLSLSGVLYTGNDIAKSFGYTTDKIQVGLLAQEVEAVLPEVVCPAPFDIGQNEDGAEFSVSGQDYKTLKYERIVPLLVEAIKEQQKQIDALRQQTIKF